MSFRCCQNCLVDMICSEPCEKFQVNNLHMNDLLSFHNCLRLLNKYKNQTFHLKHQVTVTLSHVAIYIYKNGELHRDDGPAIINKNGDLLWYQNGQYHRDDGPAIMKENGCTIWCQNGGIMKDFILKG